MQVPTELFGPFGAIVALAIGVGVLWKDHLRADAEDRKQRDDAMEGWQAATRALLARNRRDEQARRDEDP